MQCVIPCAGGSSRMKSIPKPLLIVKGKPVLSHVIDFWQSRVESFIFIVRREAMSYLWEYIPGNGAVVFQDDPKGLADAILRSEHYIQDRFVIALGDCLQVGHFESPHGYDMAVGVWDKASDEEILKSYIVAMGAEAIKTFVEKPKAITSRLCGMGTYFMDRRVFLYIRKCLPNITPGGGDFTSVLQYMADSGEHIQPNYFHGKYINVNSPADLAAADELVV